MKPWLHKDVVMEFTYEDVDVDSRRAALVTGVAAGIGYAAAARLADDGPSIAGDNYPVWEIPDDEWTRVLEVNLTRSFRMCRAAVPLPRESQCGRIVLPASVAGQEGNPGAAAYSASKAGVIALAKALGLADVPHADMARV
jgi:3-oxoacyl-[acyl-carrier protein] reductase